MSSESPWPVMRSPAPPGDVFASQQHMARPPFKLGYSLRSISAVDMRQLTQALAEAHEGTGDVRAVLLHAAFKPRLPGLTKMVSKLSKEGGWRKALEVYETVEDMGMIPDTALTNAAISACDKGGRWQKALEIFESMERLRLMRDAITYSATISSLAKGKQWHTALQVFDHMRQSGVPADVVTCCSLINALEKGGQWQLAEALFVQMCSPAGAPAGEIDGAPSAVDPAAPKGEVSPSSVLDAFLQCPIGTDSGGLEAASSPGQLTGAKTADIESELADRLHSALSLDLGSGEPIPEASRPFVAAASLTNGLMRRATSELAARAPPLEGTTALGRSLSGTPSQQQARRGLGSVHDETASVHLRRAMSSFSCQSGSDASVGENGDGTPPLMASTAACFRHAAGVTPNRVCCNALLAAYARARPSRWEKAMHLLQAMWEGVVPSLSPDAVSFNTVLKACAGAGRVDSVKDMFHEMLQRDIRPNVSTFNCLIGAITETADDDLLAHVGAWLERADRDVKQACTPVFEAAARKLGANLPPSLAGADVKGPERWSTTRTAFSPAAGTPCQAGVSPGGSLSGAASHGLVSMLLKEGQHQRVRSLFFEVVLAGQAPSEGLALGMMAACAATKSWVEALQAVRAVRGLGFEGGRGLSPAVVAAGLDALARAAQGAPPAVQAAIASNTLQLYYETQAVGYEAGTYLALIRVFAATGNAQQVVAVHELMLRDGFTPDAQGALTVLHCLLQLGEVSKASFLTNSLVTQGVRLDAETLLSLVTACGHLGSWSAGRSLCASAHMMGLPGAASAHNVLLSAAIGAGQYDVATEVLGAMQSGGIAVDPSVLSSLVALTGALERGDGASGERRSSLDGPSVGDGLADEHGGSAPASRSGSFSEAKPLPIPLPEAAAAADLGARLERLDFQEVLEQLAHAKDGGIRADEQTYRLLILAAVRGGQPHHAVQLCSQGHSLGALKHYRLPARPGGATIDLRGACLELAVTVVLTWLSLAAQLPDALAGDGKDALRIVFGNDADSIALQEAISTMLVTGEAPVTAFEGLVPVTLPAGAARTLVHG